MSEPKYNFFLLTQKKDIDVEFWHIHKDSRFQNFIKFLKNRSHKIRLTSISNKLFRIFGKFKQIRKSNFCF
jgi:hypothetical protein